MAAGDRQSVNALAYLHIALLEHSTVGKAAAHEADETRAAVNELQELSKSGLTRENLLDLLIKNAESEIRLTTMASMVRGGLDYTFFEELTSRIDAATGEEKKKLEDLRTKLLTIVDAIDKAMQAQLEEAQQLLDQLLAAENIAEATQKVLPQINQAFSEVLNNAVDKAQQANDEATLQK